MLKSMKRVCGAESGNTRFPHGCAVGRTSKDVAGSSCDMSYSYRIGRIGYACHGMGCGIFYYICCFKFYGSSWHYKLKNLSLKRNFVE